MELSSSSSIKGITHTLTLYYTMSSAIHNLKLNLNKLLLPLQVDVIGLLTNWWCASWQSGTQKEKFSGYISVARVELVRR